MTNAERVALGQERAALEGVEDIGRRRSAKRLMRARRPLRWEEALDLPGALLPELPLPPTLALRVPGVAGLVRVVPAAAEGSSSAAEVVLDADEWRAVVLGAEADRLFSAGFTALCARKRSEPRWRIGPEVALDGARPDPRERWSAARVLERIGAEVISIELEAA